MDKIKNALVIAIILVIAFLTLQFFGVVDSIVSKISDMFDDEIVEIEPPHTHFGGINNGGLTPKQIADIKELETNPSYETILRNYIIHEYADFIMIAREVKQSGSTLYPKLLFKKSTNGGLKWDGALGVTGKMKPKLLSGKHSWANFSLKIDYTNNFVPKNTGAKGWLIDDISTNVFSMSEFNTYYVEDFLFSAAKPKSEQDKLFNKSQEYLTEHLVKPFYGYLADDLKDIHVNLISNNGDKEFTYVNLNSLASYLWKNARVNGVDLTGSDLNKAVEDVYLNRTFLGLQNKYKPETNKTKLDISDYYVPLIPEELQSNFPIPQELRSSYLNKQNFPIYDTKIIANVNYTHYKVPMFVLRNANQKNDKKDAVNTLENLNDYDIPNFDYKKVVHIITLKFVNKNNSDLSSLDLQQHPLVLKLNNKSIQIKDKAKLNTYVYTAEFDSDLTIELLSNNLLFESNSLTINNIDKDASVSFYFEYYHNMIPVQFGLLNIGSGAVDLAKSNVTIVLKNKVSNNEHILKFDNNSYLTDYLSLPLSPGAYSYTILADNYIFNQTTGEVVVSASDRMFNFSFTAKNEEEKLTLESVERVENDPMYNDHFKIKFNLPEFKNLKTVDLTASIHHFPNNNIGTYIELNKFINTYGRVGENYIGSNSINGSILTFNEVVRNYMNQYSSYVLRFSLTLSNGFVGGDKTYSYVLDIDDLKNSLKYDETTLFVFEFNW